MTLDVELLKKTFNRAKNENGGLTQLGMSFYKRLFEKYPQVKPLFNTPAEEQHKKLMASVASIVSCVTNSDEMLPFLHAMGIRHLEYGTENTHYPAVNENLVSVLSEHLSVEGEWTGEMKETWDAAMTTVSDIMIDAANNPEQYKDELINAGYLPNGFKANSEKPWALAN